VCAPGGPVDEVRLAAGLQWLEACGFSVRCAPSLRARDGYLAGDDETRARDLVDMARDPEVGAVFFARGGYGVGRLLARLDPEPFRASRKLFIGYSDFTAFSLWLWRRCGLGSVHGPMLERDDLTDAARTRLLGMLHGTNDGQAPLEGRGLRAGSVEGRLVGGNLRMLAASLGTPWEIDTRGAVLFIEEIGEQPYALDRSLVQLRDSGKLAAAAGVAVGRLVNCESERYPETSACDVLERALLPEVQGPVVSGLPFGHVADNHALGVGARAALDGATGRLTPLEPVVEDLE
jgi:muramoyltetrapeptide carboxypeptidase